MACSPFAPLGVSKNFLGIFIQVGFIRRVPIVVFFEKSSLCEINCDSFDFRVYRVNRKKVILLAEAWKIIVINVDGEIYGFKVVNDFFLFRLKRSWRKLEQKVWECLKKYVILWWFYVWSKKKKRLQGKPLLTYSMKWRNSFLRPRNKKIARNFETVNFSTHRIFRQFIRIFLRKDFTKNFIRNFSCFDEYYLP